jgi:hypothetical protein
MKVSMTKLPRLGFTSTSLKKLDGLGWAAGFSLKSYGVRIGVRSNDPSALDRVSEHLPKETQRVTSPVVDRLYSLLIGGKRAHSNGRSFNLLYADDSQLARSLNLEDVFESLESDLRLFVAELARHRVFVHAGVVGWNGKAIVIPGRSYSGKSTLVAELVRAGATYYSDEYAVFDSRGRVHPYHKPLELREEGKFRQSKVTLAELGGQAGTRPLPVGIVLMTRYKTGARWRPRRLTPGKGVLEMLFHTVSARRDPERALAALQCVTAQADVLKGVRGDTKRIVGALLERMDKIS